MAAFQTQLDIANTALQRLGQPRVTSFADTTQRGAAEIMFCYDKLREAELNRNLWAFATRRVVLRAIGIDTLLWTPPTWSGAASYQTGIVTAYTPTSGIYAGETDYWQLDSSGVPGDVPGTALSWHRYTGPIAADLYDATQTYSTGELVVVPDQWLVGTNYQKNSIVNGTGANDGTWYVSLTNSNIGNAVTDTANWAPWSTGRSASGWGATSGGVALPLIFPGTPLFYLSMGSGNTDNPRSANTWVSVNGTGFPMRPVYPVGTGPSTQQSTANVFYKPHAFLRRAPQQPHAGVYSFVGMPRNLPPTDWTMEGNYIVSWMPGPIMLRFVADVVDVTDMHSMFCEGLAMRIAAELCEQLTQSAEKKMQIMQDYVRVMGEARIVNAIEVGPVDLELDSYIIVRQ